MVELEKYKKILEKSNDRLVPANPNTDSVYRFLFKHLKIYYNPNIHKDKKFREVYESIVEEGYNPTKYNYITVTGKGGNVLDGKKRIKAMHLAGVSPTTSILVKVVKVVGPSSEKEKLTFLHKGVIIFFLILTLLTFLLSKIIGLFL